MRIAVKTGLLTTGFVALTLTGMPVLALSSHARADAHAAEATTVDTSDDTTTNPTESSNSHKAAAADKQAAAKLRVCQNRQKAVTNIMARIADRGQKQVNLFTTIADRTEKFYTDKGKTLSNYDALVTDVNTKKAAAQTEVDTLKSASTTFTCDGSDPKGMAASFQTDLKAEIAALKDYKTAVKNLIVGVKSVQSTTSNTSTTTTSGTTTTTGEDQ